MVRVKKGLNAIKNRRNTLKRTKGYRHDRSRKERAANEAVAHAGNHAFAHRRKKKGDFRTLWNIKINAASRPLGLSYSQLIHKMRDQKVIVNRKMLAGLAIAKPESFSRLVTTVKKDK